jgi:hypothetical protein
MRSFILLASLHSRGYYRARLSSEVKEEEGEEREEEKDRRYLLTLSLKRNTRTVIIRIG